LSLAMVGEGGESSANAANGDMMVEMKTTIVKSTRTRRVVDWRAMVGTV
jgi:hypothetical protein